MTIFLKQLIDFINRIFTMCWPHLFASRSIHHTKKSPFRSCVVSCYVSFACLTSAQQLRFGQRHLNAHCVLPHLFASRSIHHTKKSPFRGCVVSCYVSFACLTSAQQLRFGQRHLNAHCVLPHLFASRSIHHTKKSPFRGFF